MNLLDLVLVIATIGYAIAGYRRGLVASVILFAGFLGGAVVGVWLLPYVLRLVTPGTVTATVVALLGVLVPAAIGHGLAEKLAWKVRQGLSWGPVRWVDGVGGARL